MSNAPVTTSLTLPPTTLAPLAFPLHGSRLIEASAGTGKTFTIAALYVRLVLGHGGDAAFARPLTPPEILVVTFTDAATKELRDRIRVRLAEAASRFLADPADVPDLPPGTDLLHDLRAEYPPAQWTTCARKLQLAAEWMDEAAVSTIHGWCNRMLGEHAFDSDSLFNQTLETDTSELLAEVVRDYWRTFYYPLGLADVAVLRQWWASPAELQHALRSLLAHTDVLGPGAAPPQAIGQARDAAARLLTDIKAPWAAWADELQALLDAAVDAKQVVGSKIQRRYYQPWLDALRTWAGTGELVTPDLKTGWTRLTPAGLAEAWKDGVGPTHPALSAMVDLRDRLAQLPDARSDLLRHATRWVATRFADEQARRAQMGFDDLLTRLDAALQGPNGERLAAVIRAQFPVALIDEFQDTDPLQYRIFDAVYRVADSACDRALILIGDPKQAIYAFRGADIHTYLRARRDTAGRHYTLGTNFRSTAAMVAAVNHVFAQAERRDAGHGAFLFRDAHDNPVPFHAVQAQGRDDRFVVQGRVPAALTCWLPDAGADSPEWSKTTYVQRLASVCAGEIVTLLRLGQQGDAGFDAPGQPHRALQPGDIAVLVNTGKEAAAVRQALAAGGVRSVYLSDKESVFQSPQARELQCWLAACAEPEDDRLLRAALGTASLGLRWHSLDALNQNEAVWEARVLQFRGYRQCWRRQGVLPMVRRLLADFSVPRRLLSAGGERALTDVLHLAELLQQASTQLDGEHALIRYLAEQRQDDAGGNDGRKLRLESDAALVKVVTVHKSKGLEYPLVFLPFACAFRATRPEDVPLQWHDEDGQLHVALTADPVALAQADRERLGEDLRKFYVALTRARHATWIGMAPLKALHASAPGYLLAGGEAVPPAQLAARLNALAAGEQEQAEGTMAIAPLPPPVDVQYQAGSIDDEIGPAHALQLAPREPWWITSYSGLQVGVPVPGTEEGAAEPAVPGVPLQRTQAAQTAAEDVYAESRDEPLPDAVAAGTVEPAATAGSLHAFPRGPSPGSFLHGLLEWAADQRFAKVLADPAEAGDLIARRCNLRGWSRWTGPLTAWLPAFLAAPLPLPGTAPLVLADLVGYRVETEFWFALRQVDTDRLDALVCAGTLDGLARPALLPHRLNGMLKGFIDLVFEHDGRYYVGDYKSNWLGPDDAAYTAQAMRDAVLAHRYELQYALYVFALHRLLQSRLPGYDYDRHVGGALCLFLRGTASATRGLHFERPPRSLIEALDILFSGDATAQELTP
ncbi:exodeoxyribonuclease V subunit beta [Variovorax ginsengisoli]|uniref:RecBCD enzyme subunit RecB n=1 Tax=Variovorax ginsengisoli TaxID=363844 RepID=A0ABT9SFN2_9BURK|nr:exodeoxyribonuclease V subunit beta [Variovorax ginsengisoli]MDP9902596.1 exodeoxyribonuclease V beta subunit [Variovorax ginsengisoli]